eukprot:6082028-Alexandrium_andersonii.AAC.1
MHIFCFGINWESGRADTAPLVDGLGWESPCLWASPHGVTAISSTWPTNPSDRAHGQLRGLHAEANVQQPLHRLGDQ